MWKYLPDIDEYHSKSNLGRWLTEPKRKELILPSKVARPTEISPAMTRWLMIHTVVFHSLSRLAVNINQFSLCLCLTSTPDPQHSF